MNKKNKNIIIAFDGPDNVGKGTQINLLRKWLSHIPFVILNLDKPIGSNNKEKLEYGIAASRNMLSAKKSIWQKNIPQIIDRMHYTEYAYSLLRGKHSIQEILDLEKEFIELKDHLFTIVFIDEVKNIQKRDDGKSNYNADDFNQIKDITERFVEIAERSHFDNAVININNKDKYAVQNEVKNIIKNKFPELFN